MKLLNTNSPLFAAVCQIVFISDVNAASCPRPARAAQAAIGLQVAALQRLEHEAADRLKGLDTRPFESLAGEARRITAIIADPALKDEQGPERCRTGPARTTCAEAARLLADLLDRHVASATPVYDKPQYAAAMAACEKQVGRNALKSAIRGTD